MKKLMISLLLMADLMIALAQYGTVLYNIPAGGQTVTIPSQYLNSSFITLGTDGTVNLGANSYTLTYSALPPNGYTWRVKMDFRRLTQSASGANVTIFGVKPLQAHSTVDTFDITYTVIPDSVGVKYLYYIYNGLNDGGKFNAATVFNGTVTMNSTLTSNSRANFNDTVELYGKTWLKPTAGITTSQTVVALDTTGKLGYGCTPWCLLGNAGTVAGTNFIGTTDAVDLVFKVTGAQSGRISNSDAVRNSSFGKNSLIANTSGILNTGFGAGVLYSNTTGSNNSAYGVDALGSNIGGGTNTAVGDISMSQNISGDANIGVGYASLQNNTTGNGNIGIGITSLTTLTTGSNNIGIGYNSNVATASTTKAIAIGYGATASSNQLAIAGIRSISLPNVTSAVNYVLTDTSGTGDFVPRVNPFLGQTTFTPVAHDSLTITTSQNDINPAGTLDTLTIILPASPVTGFIYEFSTTQVLTTLLWSVALSGGTTTGLPATLAQYGTVKIKWNSTLSKWLNY